MSIPRDTTCIVALDDCKMQRVVLKSYLKKMDVPHVVLGDCEDHITNPVKNLLQEAIRVLPSLSTVVCILDQNLGKLNSTTGEDAPLGTDIAQTLRTAVKADRELASRLTGGLHIYIRSANDDGASVQFYMQNADGVIQKQASWKDIKIQIANRLNTESQVQLFVDAANRRVREDEEKALLLLREDGNSRDNGERDVDAHADVDKDLIDMICNDVKERVLDVLPDLYIAQASSRSNALCVTPTKDFPNDLDGRLHGLKGALLSLEGMATMSAAHIGSVDAADVCSQISRVRQFGHDYDGANGDDMSGIVSDFHAEIDALVYKLEELKMLL